MEDGGLHDGQGDNIRILINLSGVAQVLCSMQYVHCHCTDTEACKFRN